jgi:hypothetical protein
LLAPAFRQIPASPRRPTPRTCCWRRAGASRLAGSRPAFVLLQVRVAEPLAWPDMSVSGSPLRWFRHRFDGCFSLPAVASSSTSCDCPGADQILAKTRPLTVVGYDRNLRGSHATPDARVARKAGPNPAAGWDTYPDVKGVARGSRRRLTPLIRPAWRPQARASTRASHGRDGTARTRPYSYGVCRPNDRTGARDAR